ncbi:MAG: hypothetical protein RDU83_03875 [bacterium]|nr:hypothetical protein [bacterium]
MQPFEEIRRLLPSHLRLEVTARYVEIHCARCFVWTPILREKATELAILAAAEKHRCPQ